MKQTQDALEILDDLFGDDPRYQSAATEERARIDIADQIFEARRAAGFTQKRLADAIGTSQSVIARLEGAEYHGYTLSLLRRIGDALGRDVHVSLVKKGELNVSKDAPVKKRSVLLKAVPAFEPIHQFFTGDVPQSQPITTYRLDDKSQEAYSFYKNVQVC